MSLESVIPAGAGAAPAERPAPPYFSVSTRKFAILFTCTFGLYGIYWFYKHWRIIRDQEGLDIIPVMRALFQIFFVYALFDHVNNTARKHDLNAAIAAGPLAAGFIILSLLSNLPDPYWLVCYLSILTLLPAQDLMNTVNARVAPEAPVNDRITGANVAVIVAGVLLFGLAVIGMLLPPDGGSAEPPSEPKSRKDQPVVLAPEAFHVRWA